MGWDNLKQQEIEHFLKSFFFQLFPRFFLSFGLSLEGITPTKVTLEFVYMASPQHIEMDHPTRISMQNRVRIQR